MRRHGRIPHQRRRLTLEASPKLNLDGVLNIVQKTSRAIYYTAGATNGFVPAQVVVKKRETWEIGHGYVNADAAMRVDTRLNTNRTTINTTSLPGWNSTMGLAACAVNAKDEHLLIVPAGASALRVLTDWGNPAYDLDLYVYNPAGQLVGSSGQGASINGRVSMPNVVAGQWTVVPQGHLNAPTTYTGTAEIDKVRTVK